MNLRTYHAYSMAEALEAVKSDLGEDAVILHTRTFRRGGVLGLGAKQIVEVTAADGLPAAESISERTRPAKAAVASVSATEADVIEAKKSGTATVSALQARKAYGLKASRQPGIEASSGGNATGQAASILARAAEQVTKERAHAPVVSVRAPLEEKVKVAPPARSVAPPAPEPVITHPVKKWVPEPLVSKPVQAKSAASVAAPPAQSKVVEVKKPAPPVARKQSPAPPASQMNAVTKAPHAAPKPPSFDSQAMQDELSAIRDMVGQVLQRQAKSTGKTVPGVPQQLFDMYLQLISHDLAEEVADEVVSKVAKALPPDKLDDAEAVRAAVLTALTQYIPVSDTPTPELSKADDGRPMTIALVGPTGVGKTTTLAKLAASFKLHQKKNVGLITCDTYRIAAVDQLTTYAKIIGVPLRVARSPEEMKLAVGEFAGCDVVLIDTAGRGQRDSERLTELGAMIKAGNPHEVHLVLSSTANEKVLLSEAEAFAPLGAEKIVLTKLDEAVSFGMLVNVLRTVGKRLSFVTTGQEVPDDFELGSAEKLAELVLGTKGDV